MSRGFLLLIVCLAASSAAAPLPELQGTTYVGDKAIADAVVWLEAPNAPRPATPRPAVLDQRNLSFAPHVLAVEVGTRVKFPNDDRVFHDVFSYHDGARFDLGLYPVGSVKDVPFNQPGLSRIFCNIHPNMAAYVMAVDTPFFAVSDEAGHFVIRGVPSGSYAYHAWRPGGTIKNDTVVVGDATSFAVRWP